MRKGGPPALTCRCIERIVRFISTISKKFWARLTRGGEKHRSLALGELTLRDWRRVLLKEFFSGLILGLFLGMVGFCRIMLWQHLHLADYGTHYFLVATTVWLSLIGVVLFGTVTGSMLPLILRWAGFDPATGAEPFVATLVDVSGLIIYFSVAMLILRGTLL